MALRVHALACAFGLGSWVAVNGLWVELPLLVGVLPEGWALPSYLTVIIQLANVGPLAMTLVHRLCPGALREAPVIAGVLAVGVLACALLAAFWRRTNCILGQERSSAFLALTFFLALVDCTSSVTFLPFMIQLPARYVSSYFIGEGLSGFLPGLLALAQGVGVARCVNASEPPTNPNASQGLALQAEYHPLAGQGLALQTEYHPPAGQGLALQAEYHPHAGQGLALQTEYLAPSFSPEAFFVLLAVMTSVSLLAFILLRRLPHTYQLSAEHLVSSEGVSGEGVSGEGVSSEGVSSEGVSSEGVSGEGVSSEGVSSEGVSGEGVPVPAVCVGVEPLGVGGGDPAKRPPGAEERGQRRALLAKRGYSGAQQAFIYAMVVWANSATNGLLPSVQTYSCMPYGSLAYHLSAALASLANPLACIIAMLRPQRSLVCLGVLCVLGSGFGGYNMAMAAMSPCPLLQQSPLGAAVIVISWVLFTGLLSYVKVMVGVILRDESHSALVWCGAATQVGSLLGSVTMFPLISIYQLFTAGDICNTTCPL